MKVCYEKLLTIFLNPALFRSGTDVEV